jgi:hypothetical protein
VAEHPELGLGTPSKSTVGVILKRFYKRPKDKIHACVRLAQAA